MNGPDIRDLLERVHRGELPPGDAEVLLADHMRALPFEDFGFRYATMSSTSSSVSTMKPPRDREPTGSCASVKLKNR